jgi:hypothetical protein
MLRFQILLFYTSLLTAACAQNDAVFIVASYSEGVSVDDTPVQVGQLVSSNSKQLSIPKNGYALIVVKGGYPLKLTKSIPINRVENRVQSDSKSRLIFGPAIVCHFPGIDLIGTPTNQYSDLAGDSILIAIKPIYGGGKPPYKIEFTDMFGTVLSSDSTVANWRVYEVKRSLTQHQFLIFNVSGKGFGGENLIKLLPDERKKSLNAELAQVTNSGSSALLKLTIFEHRKLYYDHMFLLYQVTKSNYKPENKILEAYLNRLKEKYEFKLFNFQKD